MSANAQACERVNCTELGLAPHPKHKTKLPDNVEDLYPKIEAVEMAAEVKTSRVGLLSLPDDVLTSVGSYVLAMAWEDHIRDRSLEASYFYQGSLASGPAQAEGAISWRVLAPLAHLNHRLRRAFEGLMWQMLVLRGLDQDLETTLEHVGAHVTTLRVQHISGLARSLELCPNISDIALSMTTQEWGFGNVRRAGPRLAEYLNTLLVALPLGQCRSFAVVGRIAANTDSAVVTSPMSLAAVGAFSSMRTLSFRGMFKPCTDASKQSEAEELLVADLLQKLHVVSLCSSLATLNLAVGQHRWPTDREWETLRRLPPIEELDVAWYEACEVPEGFFDLLQKLLFLESLVIHARGLVADRPNRVARDGYLKNLKKLHISGPPLESSLRLLRRSDMSSLVEIMAHDDHQLFRPRTDRKARVMYVLDQVQAVENVVRDRAGVLSSMSIHAHREHRARVGGEDRFDDETRECETLLPRLLQPVCDEAGVKFQFSLHA